MPEVRRQFTRHFRDETVQLVLQTGRPVAQVAKDLDINEGTLGNWVKKHRADNPEPEKPLTVDERARLKEQEEEIRRLKMENEFLKKAAAFFAKQTP